MQYSRKVAILCTCAVYGLFLRVALGALLVKERLGLTDRETVETIQENPYPLRRMCHSQFFLGMEEFT